MSMTTRYGVGDMEKFGIRRIWAREGYVYRSILFCIFSIVIEMLKNSEKAL